MAFLFYFFVLYLTIKNKDERWYLIVFGLLILVTSIIMFININTPMGNVMPPLVLLLVIVLPFLKLIVAIFHKGLRQVKIWGVAFITACLHSMSWCIWFFAITGS